MATDTGVVHPQDIGTSEASPLLPSPLASPPTNCTSDHDDNNQARLTFHLGLLVLFLAAGSYFLLIAPITQLKELAICKQYYGLTWELGSDCKVELVQSALASLMGWQQLLDCLPAILLGISYGSLADHYGRRPILALSLFGMSMGAAWIQVVLLWSDTLPIKLTWLSSAFYLIGGGPIIAVSMIFVVISDISTDEQRASNFFRLNAVALLGEIFLAPLSSLLMKRNPWISARLGLAALIVSTLVVITALPETVSFHKPRPGLVSSADDNAQLDHDPDKTFWQDTRSNLVSRIKHLRFIWVSPQLILLVVVFSVGTLYRSSSEFLLQYVSRRYNWELSEAGFLLSYRAAVNFILLIGILPGVSFFLLKHRQCDAPTKDLWLLRASTLSMALGTLVTGLAPHSSLMIIGLTLFALGHGFVPVILSLATSLVDQAHIGILYNVLAVSETVGSLINGPMLASSFRFGMKTGGVLTGLPFIITGVIFLLASLAVFTFRIPKGSSGGANNGIDR